MKFNMRQYIVSTVALHYTYSRLNNAYIDRSINLAILMPYSLPHLCSLIVYSVKNALSASYYVSL
jgi:hypothetical protein